MAMAMAPLLLLHLLLLLFSSAIAIAIAVALPSPSPSSSLRLAPSPTPWPLQFHSLLFVNTSSFTLQALDLWYDWPNSRNFNIIHKQLNGTLHDLEWSNGTSFYYDLGARTCKTVHFEVGILRPDWLVDNSTYLGQHVVDGFTCNAWSKLDFIVYYEDVETKRPVHWVFYTGMSLHVMSFEVGAVLEDSQWQAPAYCFDDDDEEEVEEEEEEEEVAKPLLMMTDAARHDKERLRRWHDSLQASLIQ